MESSFSSSGLVMVINVQCSEIHFLPSGYFAYNSDTSARLLSAARITYDVYIMMQHTHTHTLLEPSVAYEHVAFNNKITGVRKNQ